MKGKSSTLFITTVALSLGACTISARDPVAPKESDSQKEADQSAKATSRFDEDFTLPEAEQVTDDDEQLSASSPVASSVQGFAAGSARIVLGDHPPFNAPEVVRPLGALTTPPTNLKKQWRLKKTLKVGHGYLHQAQFTPDQKSVVTLSTDTGSLYHFELSSGRLKKEIKLPDFEQFEFASFVVLQELEDRTQVVVTRPSGTSVLDLESGKLDPLTKVPAGTDAEHTGVTGLYGISLRNTAPQSGQITFEWLSQGVAATLDCEKRPDGWSMTPDGRWLAVSYYPGETAEIIDLKERKLVATFPLPKWGSAVAFSPDGSLLAMGGEKLRIVKVPSGELVAEDDAYENNVSNVRFTPDSSLLLTAAFDGKARSYVLPQDLSTLSKLPAPQTLAHDGRANVYALGLSSDGRLLVTSAGDKNLKVWER